MTGVSNGEDAAQPGGEISADLLDDLESRILAIENSLVFRSLRRIGRIGSNWKGRLGQLLLHSPLHPLYLRLRPPHSQIDAYRIWLEEEARSTPGRDWFDSRALQFKRRPSISVVMPVCNPDKQWLEAAIDSVRNQSWPCWQLCLCDDFSSEPWVAEQLTREAVQDNRFAFVRAGQRLGISGALNRAALLAKGDYLAFLDQDDLLAPHALHYVAQALQNTDADLLYSDEDKLDEAGRRIEPIFKPAWSPDLLLSCMYLGHLLVVRRDLFNAISGFRSEADGSQDHDLALRMADRDIVVRHIPRVLYHWRKHADSTAASPGAKPYTQDAGRRAVAEAMARRGIAATVEDGPQPHTYHVHRAIHTPRLASLIICSRKPRLAGKVLRSIARNTDYANRETVLVEHGVDLRVSNLHGTKIRYDGDFNFSRMNNIAVQAAKGEWLVFLNDDVEPLDPKWLTELLAHIQRPEAGIAGARLLYPSGSCQHAGIVTGIMGDTGHPLRNTFASPWWHWGRVTRNVSAVTGACMAIRKSVFEELGGFDETFPVNFNDVDLCLRARQKEYQVIYEPAAVLRHRECQTRAPVVRWRERAAWRRKWPQYYGATDPYYSPHLVLSREDASIRTDEPMRPEDNCR